MPFPSTPRLLRVLLPCLLVALSCNFEVRLPAADAFLPTDSAPTDTGIDSTLDLDDDTSIQCHTHAECEALGEALLPCQQHKCDFERSRCILAPVPDNTSCNDDNPCTLEDKCLNGSCEGSPKICPESDPCTTAECDPANGNCVYHAVPDCQECAGQGEPVDEFTPCCADLKKISNCQTLFDGMPCIGTGCIFWCECVMEAHCAACGDGFCNEDIETACNCPEDCYPAPLPSCDKVGGTCGFLVSDSPPTCADGPSIPFPGCSDQQACCIPSADNCLGAGEKFSTMEEHLPCCPPLDALPQDTIGEDGSCVPGSPIHVCSRCGDGICNEKGEDRCNCPDDCNQ